MKKLSYLICLSLLFVFLLNTNILFAQIEDDEFDLAEDEIVCIPESLMTIYDGYDYRGISFDNMRQWYSFGRADL